MDAFAPDLYVGLMVHYVSYGTPNGEYTPQHRAAVVTDVLNTHAVSLCVLNPTGFFFNVNVLRDDSGFQGGTWHFIEGNC